MTAAQHAMAEGDYALAAQRLIYARDAEPAQRRRAAADDARLLAGRRPPRRRPRGARLGARRRRPPDAAPLRLAHLRGHGRDRPRRGGRRSAPPSARRRTPTPWERLGRLRLRLMDRARRDRRARARARASGPTVEGLLDLALASTSPGDLGGEVTAVRAGDARRRASRPQAWSRYAHALARTDRVSDAIAAAERALHLDAADAECRRPARAPARGAAARAARGLSAHRFLTATAGLRAGNWRAGVRSARARFSRRTGLPNRSRVLAACDIACSARVVPLRWPCSACSPPVRRRAGRRGRGRHQRRRHHDAARRSTRRRRSASAGCARSCAGTRSRPAGPVAGTRPQIARARRDRRRRADARTSRCSSSCSARRRGPTARPIRSSRRATPPTSRRFTRRDAARYHGRVAAWEIWNEPDDAQFWHGAVGARRVRAAAARRLPRDQGRRRRARSCSPAPRPATTTPSSRASTPPAPATPSTASRRTPTPPASITPPERLLPRERPRRALQLPRLPRDARRARGPRPGRQADLPLGDRLVGDARRRARAARAPARRPPASARPSRPRTSSSPTAAWPPTPTSAPRCGSARAT